MRTVCGLDIHKDSIFMCILDGQGGKSERKFGVSTREIREQSAAIIISEIGDDMKFFATASALVSWAGLSPRNDESAGKIKSRKITHGNKYLRRALMESAWGAARTRGSAFNRKFWHLRGRNKKEQKCVVAVARSMLVVIWSLLTSLEDFDFNYLNRYTARPA